MRRSINHVAQHGAFDLAAFHRRLSVQLACYLLAASFPLAAMQQAGTLQYCRCEKIPIYVSSKQRPKRPKATGAAVSTGKAVDVDRAAALERMRSRRATPHAS